MTATDRLWGLISAGEIPLDNRAAMAPMTRDRSTPAGVPTGMNAEYYAQQASTGLIVTKATQPSDDGQGYLLTPGIYTTGRSRGGGMSPTRSTRSAGGS